MVLHFAVTPGSPSPAKLNLPLDLGARTAFRMFPSVVTVVDDVLVVLELVEVVVVGFGGSQAEGSASQVPTAQFFPRNLLASSLMLPGQRMQNRVPVPNCTWMLTLPWLPSSASV